MSHHAIVYSREGCCLCDRAKELLQRLQGDFDLEIEEVDITTDPELLQRYQYTIPVVVIDGVHRFESKIAEHYLRRVLRLERERTRQWPWRR